MGEKEALLVALGIGIIISLVIGNGALTIATTSGSGTSANLTIYDKTNIADSEEQYTFCQNFCTQKNKASSGWNVYFYANYTNTSFSPINTTNGAGNCTIRFNETGTFTGNFNMTFNSSLLLFEYNRSFTYKGVLNFSANCTSTYSNITLADSLTISNTDPYVIVTAAGYIDFNADLFKDTLSCTEDSICTYNFTTNVSEDDANDVLTFNYTSNANTTLTNFTLNVSTGVLTINVTHTNATGSRTVELTVDDNTAGGIKSGVLQVNISAVNDAPSFSNLQNQTFNASSAFNYTIFVTDEENDTSFTINITFINCTVASWSTRNCSTSAGRELFNSSQYNANGTSGVINITFTPTKNDVGDYIINFSVGDARGANISQLVNFSVLNVNAAPFFVYTCDSERLWNESNRVLCYLNVSDVDESSNLTVIANYTWFAFNNASNASTTNRTVVSVPGSGNISVLVNFTANDSLVGRWYVNISVQDTGLQGVNSTILQFNISNFNDSVNLYALPNVTVYTTNNYTLYINASDDDLFVPDKSIFNESLRFYSNNSCVGVGSQGQISGTNITQASVQFNATNSSCFSGGLNYTVLITVNDSNNFSNASRTFTIFVLSNNAPTWNASTNLSLTENINFFLNASKNASDPEGDTITFSYTNESAFPAFSLNTTTGIINITPGDEDVGINYINITASDNATGTRLRFNFTVYNVNDDPSFNQLQADNATIDSTSNVNISEDNHTVLYIYVRDNDFRITQKTFYNESINVTVVIQGPNTTLFTLSRDSSFPTASGADGNRSLFTATFSPGENAIGSYNVTFNATDASNISVLLRINMTIVSISHAPSFNLTNQTSTYNRTLHYDINASDAEDGTDSTNNLTYSYGIVTNSTYIDSLLAAAGAFNATRGIINVTFNDSHVGNYTINITVRDQSGTNTTNLFSLTVYGPIVLSIPVANTNFTIAEYNWSNITFRVNHTVGDNLTYQITAAGILSYNRSYYGNTTNLTWSFLSNYTDETHGGFANLTLFVFNPLFADVNATRTWNFNITHSNAPLNFTDAMPNKSATIVENITYNLTLNFLDVDYNDVYYNQTPTYTLNRSNSSTGIGYSISNNILYFTPPPAAASETFNITANDSGYNVTSNPFTITFTATTSTSSSTGGGGGGGGGGGTAGIKPVPFRLIIPGPIVLERRDRIIIPVIIENTGEVDLSGILLSSLVAKNGSIFLGANATFDNPYIALLTPKTQQRANLTIETDTDEAGVYALHVNATVQAPVYKEGVIVYLTVKDSLTLKDKIIFTEEFIVGNPECVELKELVNEARKSLSNGDAATATAKVEEALSSCKRAIEQKPIVRKVGQFTSSRIVSYATIASIMAAVIGILYYSYRRRQMQKFLSSSA